MMRAAVSLAALIAASPALGAEGGPILSGEHPGFSRIVMTVEPTTEWSLELGQDRATVTFPGKSLDFDASDVFELIPRTRIAEVETSTGPEGTAVEVLLNCDCRISTTYVGANYLALDVRDRDAARAEVAPQPMPEAPEAAQADLEADPFEPASTPEPESPEPETPEARVAREAALVASAEDMLIQQIERAADQGLIQLKDIAPKTGAAEERPEPVEATTIDALGPEPAEPEPAETPAGDPAPDEREPAEALASQAAPEGPPPAAEDTPPEAPAIPQAGAAPAVPAAQIAAALPESDTIDGLLDHTQISATTVFERDGRAISARIAEPAVPSVCREDEALDVGAWTNGLPLHRQVPPLSRLVVGEFDRPDLQALADLARLYIRFGFGVEAESLLNSFDVTFPDKPLLVDLARAVEGRPVLAGDGLALDAPCPGRHGLWLAIGGDAPAYRDEAQFAEMQDAFADLPPDLRTLVGPRVVERLLEGERPVEARIILDIVERPAAPRPVELRLAAARVVAAEDRPVEAVEALNGLVEENAHNAVDALAAMVRIALDADIALPERTIVDLRSAALQHRDSPREAELRGLLAEALARRAQLADAVDEIIKARVDLPPSIPQLDALAVHLLAEADPVVVGASVYGKVILEHADLIGPAARNDPARREIAVRLLDLGLANAALEILAPASDRGNARARVLAARAHLRLGDGDAALALLADNRDAEAPALRARALAQTGRFGEALETLSAEGLDDDGYVWPSGNWTRARETADSAERMAMASYMAARSGETEAAAPAEDPAALGPDEAFQQPVPSLERPSLGAARALLATSQQVTGFVADVLKND